VGRKEISTVKPVPSGLLVFHHSKNLKVLFCIDESNIHPKK